MIHDSVSSTPDLTTPFAEPNPGSVLAASDGTTCYQDHRDMAPPRCARSGRAVGMRVGWPRSSGRWRASIRFRISRRLAPGWRHRAPTCRARKASRSTTTAAWPRLHRRARRVLQAMTIPATTMTATQAQPSWLASQRHQLWSRRPLPALPSTHARQGPLPHPTRSRPSRSHTDEAESV